MSGEHDQEPRRERQERRGAAARQVPSSESAELGLLGSLLLSPQEVAEVCDERGIGEDHFNEPHRGLIYKTAREVIARPGKTAFDFIMLTQVLRDREQLDAVGGEAAVTEMFTYVPTAANAGHYADILVEKYLLRRIIGACDKFAGRAYEDQEDVKALCDEYQAELLALTEIQSNGEDLRHIKPGVAAALDTIENAYNHRGRTTGTPTGFVQYDRMTNGLHPGEMTVIAARPSMGKTAIGVNMLEYISMGDPEKKLAGQPVAIFSLEMSYEQLAQRIVCGQSRVSLQRVRDGFLSDADFPKLMAAAEKVAAAPIYIDDTPQLRILEFRARARRAKRKYGIVAILVDYLQLMRGNSKRAAGDRQLEVCEISAGLKATAKELQIPVIVLAQLNRDPDKRKGGETKLSDLRESGSIEQDADVVAMLRRPEYYVADKANIPTELQGLAILDVAKQRNGGVGPVNLRFVHDLTRFENRDPNERLYSNRADQRQGGWEDEE